MHPSITIQKEASPHGVPIDDPLFDTIRKGRVECVVLFPNDVWTTSADTYILDTCTSLINTWNAKHVEHYVVYCKYSAIQEEVNAYAFKLFNIHVIAMQFDAFVITSGSNWSRLIEEFCYGRKECSIYDTTEKRPNDWR